MVSADVKWYRVYNLTILCHSRAMDKLSNLEKKHLQLRVAVEQNQMFGLNLLYSAMGFFWISETVSARTDGARLRVIEKSILVTEPCIN